MGIFDKLFKKHKGDDKYILFAKAGLLLSHADGDFSDQENQWIVDFIRSIPKITEDRVDNILKKGSENLEEIPSFSELKSVNDKKELIDFLIGVAKADGNLDALELKFITNLIEHLSLQDEYEDFLDSIDNSDNKSRAFLISMFKVAVAEGPEIDEDVINFMHQVAEEFQLPNFPGYFGKIFDPLEGPILFEEYDKYIKSLSIKEFEELLFILIKLSLLDKKLTNLEIHQINVICSLFKHPRDIHNEMIQGLINTNFTQKSDDNDYILFRSYLDIFNEAIKKSSAGEENDALLLNTTLLSQLNKEKLLFGKLIENKIYVEGSEMIPLGNIYFNRGQSYEALGKKTEALNDFIMATTIDPEMQNPLFFHHAGCLMFELGDHTNCIDYYDRAINVNEEDCIDSYYMRGVAYLSDKCEKQNIKLGKADLEKYLKHNPNDPAALSLMNAIKD